MVAKKRILQETPSAPRAKKAKLAHEPGSAPKQAGTRKPRHEHEAPDPTAPISSLIQDEIDFPRGGGTSFTPLEVKSIRQEGLDEADDEVFKVCVTRSYPFN
jgi:rRNA biogenesis protein RRP5